MQAASRCRLRAARARRWSRPSPMSRRRASPSARSERPERAPDRGQRDESDEWDVAGSGGKRNERAGQWKETGDENGAAALPLEQTVPWDRTVRATGSRSSRRRPPGGCLHQYEPPPCDHRRGRSAVKGSSVPGISCRIRGRAERQGRGSRQLRRVDWEAGA
jgi:hypothetical protein